MNTQETKAVEEYAKKLNWLEMNAFIQGAQFLDTLRKVSEPDKELLEALKHAKSLITLSSMSDDTIINNAISKYESK